jgi:hypothetical protein
MSQNMSLKAMLLALLLLVSGCDQELASKQEWSVVQAVEAEHRGSSTEGIQFVTKEGFSLVGLPASSGGGKVWVLLNPTHAPYYKQLPPGNYKLTKEDNKKILQRGGVSSTVTSCLASHMDDP